MVLRIPRLQESAQIAETGGQPTFAFHRWWDSVAESVENSFNNLISNLVLAGLLNEDGTLADDKVGTGSIQSNAVTIPWLAYSDTTINPVEGSDTEVFVIAVTKEIDESLLEVHGQLPLQATDAVDVEVTYSIKQGATVVASRMFSLKVDGNGTTDLPFSYEHYFDAIDAGDYDVYMYVQRTSTNLCNTIGQYHMRIREFKR